MIRSHSSLAVSAGAILVLLVGCTSQTVEPSPTNSLTVKTPAAADAGLVIPRNPPAPFDAYRDPSAQISWLHATMILTDACMRKYGFDPPKRRVAELPPQDPYLRDARIGYRQSPEVAQWYASRQQDPTPAQEPSAAYNQVLNGTTSEGQPVSGSVNGVKVPEGGCEGQAMAELLGGSGTNSPIRVLEGSPALVKDLSIKTDAQTQSDSRFLAATQQWSQCMQRQGMPYANPDDASAGKKIGDGAPGEPFASPWSTYSSPQELATIKADVSCQLEVDYQGKITAVRDEYERKAIEANQLQLNAIAEAQKALTARAAAVIKANG